VHHGDILRSPPWLAFEVGDLGRYDRVGVPAIREDDVLSIAALDLAAHYKRGCGYCSDQQRARWMQEKGGDEASAVG
jgi:hypothetical protein